MEYRGIWAENGQPVEIGIGEGQIVSIREIPREPGLPFLCPGFFDIQINGYQGIDYSSNSLSPEQVLELCKTLVKTGTTRHLATIITTPKERVLHSLRAIVEARKRYPFVQKSLVGVHLEGPYISPEDGPRGAHNRLYVRPPDKTEFETFQKAAEGIIKLVTLAPEQEGALAFISYLKDQGVVPAIGHTGATPERIREAVNAGALLSTHLGNGSHAQIPRLRNYIWEQLAADSLYASLICDGFHLPPAVIKVIARAKGIGRLILVSDVAYVGGLKAGTYRWGTLEVELHPDGHITQIGTPFFAGAGHLLDRGIVQFMKATGLGWKEALQTCTTNPARLLGMEEEGFALCPGTPAHLVQFRYSEGSESIQVEQVVFEGEWF
ncbi:MAG: amidohydrolase family protein [Spirochaetales bacterium]